MRLFFSLHTYTQEFKLIKKKNHNYVFTLEIGD